MDEVDFIIFYGAGCPECEEIRLEMAQLSYKRGFQYSEKEVWNNTTNAQLFDELVDQSIDAVPVIYHTKTQSVWAGESLLKDWIMVY
jgi:hypothetical protein